MARSTHSPYTHVPLDAFPENTPSSSVIIESTMKLFPHIPGVVNGHVHCVVHKATPAYSLLCDNQLSVIETFMEPTQLTAAESNL